MATLDPPLCSLEEQSISGQPNAPLHCLTRNETIVFNYVAQFSVMSLCACILAFALILRNIHYHARKAPGRWRLIKGPMDVYLLSLFTAETFLAFGGSMNAKWISDGKSRLGSWCSAQAVTLVIGDTNTAVSTLAITIHTFVMVWCNKGFRAIKVAWISMSIPWIFSIIYSAVLSTYRQEPPTIFRPSPYWCWVGRNYLIHRLLGAYLWFWLSLLASLLLYIPLFFWGRGNITIGDKFWHLKFHRRQKIEDPEGIRQRALRMIAYPLLYALLVLPLSVTRWTEFMQENHDDRKSLVPGTAILATQAIYKLSGIVNVALFLVTRPNLLLFTRRNDENREADAITGNHGDVVKITEWGTSRDADSMEGATNDQEDTVAGSERDRIGMSC